MPRYSRWTAEQSRLATSDPAVTELTTKEDFWLAWDTCGRSFAGEILIWWGVYLAAVPVFLSSPGSYAGFATVVSPLFTMWVLLCLSCAAPRRLEPFGPPRGRAWRALFPHGPIAPNRRRRALVL